MWFFFAALRAALASAILSGVWPLRCRILSMTTPTIALMGLPICVGRVGGYVDVWVDVWLDVHTTSALAAGGPAPGAKRNGVVD